MQPAEYVEIKKLIAHYPKFSEQERLEFLSKLPRMPEEQVRELKLFLTGQSGATQNFVAQTKPLSRAAPPRDVLRPPAPVLAQAGTIAATAGKPPVAPPPITAPSPTPSVSVPRPIMPTAKPVPPPSTIEQSELRKSASRLIQESPVLSEADRAEWMRLLPNMSAQQISELLDLLYVPSKQTPSVSLGPQKPSLPSPAVQPIPSPTVNARLSPPKPQVLAGTGVAAGRAAMATREQEVPPVRLPHKELVLPPTAGVVPLSAYIQHFQDIRTLSDLKRIGVSALRDGSPHAALGVLLSKILMIVQQGVLPHEIFNHLRESPLYRTYMAFGAAVMNDLSADRHASFARIKQQLSSAGKDYLDREEFEALADFRRELERVLYR